MTMSCGRAPSNFDLAAAAAGRIPRMSWSSLSRAPRTQTSQMWQRENRARWDLLLDTAAAAAVGDASKTGTGAERERENIVGILP